MLILCEYLSIGMNTLADSKHHYYAIRAHLVVTLLSYAKGGLGSDLCALRRLLSMSIVLRMRFESSPYD